MTAIVDVDAWEVLDSRGHPTVRARVTTERGSGVFTAPAGASVGTHEAVELRDGGDRFGGLGVRTAVSHVRNEIKPALLDREVTAQREIDRVLVGLDGTPTLSRLGANAVLSVSGAVARAAGRATDEPLHSLFAAGHPAPDRQRLPMPMVNVISGGRHAAGRFDVQDLLVIPRAADSYREALLDVWNVRSAIRRAIIDRGHTPLVADEGGFAPPLEGIEAVFELVTAGIRAAGYQPGTDIALGLDVAATEFFEPETQRYELANRGEALDSEGMRRLVASWVDEWPIVSVEDPLAEDDWAAWAELRGQFGDDVQLIGDDLITTNLDRLHRAIDRGAANAVLIKPNQAGTFTRAIDVASAAKEAGFATVMSARSGETCDSTIADLAVGRDLGQIKIGSLARSERVAKYNRLLAIAREHDGPFAAAEPRPGTVGEAARLRED